MTSRAVPRRRAVLALGVALLGLALTACSAQQAVTPTTMSTRAPRPPGVPVPRVGAPLPRLGFARSELAGSAVATAYHLASSTPGGGVVTVVVFDGARTRLVLHAGSTEPAPGLHLPDGPTIGAQERSRLLAAFNGGFKMRSAKGGWQSDGVTVDPLRAGAASVVVYRDGGTDIGRWGVEVPTPGRPVVSVRQNLGMLVDGGRPGPVRPLGQAELEKVWGHTFHHEHVVSRSALGVTATGDLVWAAGTDVSVAALAGALLAHGVVRALELDINAPLVRGFLFAGAARLSTGGTVLPLVVGQRQVLHDPSLTRPAVAPHCTYLVPCTRDFFTVVVR